jgi:hypothetical protein
MTEYPFTLNQIVGWFSTKQAALAGTTISMGEIRKRTEHLPAAVADFDGSNVIGRISGWISGEFDFETLRVSDGEHVFWRHISTRLLDDLEDAYADFLLSLRGSDGS